MLALKPLTEKSTEQVNRVSFGLTGDGIVIVRGSFRTRDIYGIDATDLSITDHIPDDADLSGEDVLSLAYLSYLYVLRIADTRMIRRLTTVDRDVVTRTRDSVFTSKDLVNYKIATLRCCIQHLTPNDREQVEEHFRACGLRREDAILYYLLYYNNDIQQFNKQLQTITDETFSLDVKVLSKEVGDGTKVYSEFEKTATYWTNKRLRFIANGNRWQFIDMRNELIKRAIAAYYWVRPFYSKLHALNYAKRGLDGYSKVLIEYYTKPERARVYRDEDGNFQNILRDITDDVFSSVDIYEEENALIDYIDEKRDYR